MAVFKTINHKGITFNRNPSPSRYLTGKGWAIAARASKEYYNGDYVRNVGWADEVEGGHIAFRLKRDAVRAIEEAINLGILVRDEK